MITPLRPLPKTPLKLLKEGAYFFRDKAAKVYGKPSAGMQTGLRKDGRNVVFIHNPKTAGTSLGKYLGVKQRTHTFPSDRLSINSWRNAFLVVTIRDPFDRFLSGYFDHVCKPKANALTRIYGPAFKSIAPLEYLDIILKMPKFGGSQLKWTHYPCLEKPQADLILRFEEIDSWEKQIDDAGIIVNNPSIVHHNAGLPARVEPLKALSISESEFRDLEKTVRRSFLADAIAFGYPLC